MDRQRKTAVAMPKRTFGLKRSQQLHASTTDPDALLYRKGNGKETKLSFIGHGLMENRHGLQVDACLTQADGHAEQIAALHVIDPPSADRPTAITLGADKAYDAEHLVNQLRSMNDECDAACCTEHQQPSSAIDVRTSRHGRYAVTPRIRKRSRRHSAGLRRAPGQKKIRFRDRELIGWTSTSLPLSTIWYGCPS